MNDPWAAWKEAHGYVEPVKRTRVREEGEIPIEHIRLCTRCGQRFFSGRNKFASKVCGMCEPRDQGVVWSECPGIVARGVVIDEDDRNIDRANPERDLRGYS